VLNVSFTGILVILSLLFFTPYFFYIPKSALAGIIIAAVIFMVEVRVVKPMWRSKKSDLIPGLAAFVACLVLPLELGILVGIGINVVFILYHASRPKIHMEKMIVSFPDISRLFSNDFFQYFVYRLPARVSSTSFSPPIVASFFLQLITLEI
jgi:MFS superfamily sulfate permease-like transporter